jgi:anti-anti-sigma factor
VTGMRELATLRIEQGEPVIIAHVIGEIDASNVREVEAQILDAVQNSAFGLVLDLADVTYLDSACVQMLGDLAQRVGWREQRLALVAPAGSRVHRVLTMAGTDIGLAAEPSRDAAVERVMSADRFGY